MVRRASYGIMRIYLNTSSAFGFFWYGPGDSKLTMHLPSLAFELMLQKRQLGRLNNFADNES